MSSVCLAVGQWHGRLCASIEPYPRCLRGDRRVPEQAEGITLDRPRVTCASCLVALDRLEELGWPVKSRLQWWEGYVRKGDGRWRERLWRYGYRPSPAQTRQALARGHRVERVRVIDARSLAHWASTLRGEP